MAKFIPLSDQRDPQMFDRWSSFVGTPRFKNLERKAVKKIVDEGNGIFSLPTDDGKLVLRNRIVDDIISRLDPVFGSDSGWGGCHISNTDSIKNSLVIGSLCYTFARQHLTPEAFKEAVAEHAGKRELWKQKPQPVIPTLS